jgi:hypothetical protein
VGVEPRFLREYAHELKHSGERRFRGRFDYPVLVCISIVGEVKDEPRWHRRTLPMEGNNEYVPMQSILHRVWPVRLASGRRDKFIIAGQDGQCDIVVPEYTVSRQHCAFTADPREVHKVTDLGSLNGTTLDDHPLEVEQLIRIRSGSTLAMGRMKFLYYNISGFMARLDQV